MSENNRRELAELIAKEQGLVILEPLPQELFLDLDTLHARVQYTHVRPTFEKLMAITGELKTTSKGGNMHVYIRIEDPMDMQDKILCQAALGSDGVKELLSLKRLMHSEEPPVLLFETPEEAERVEEWRRTFEPKKKMRFRLVNTRAGRLTSASPNLETDDDLVF